MAKIGLIAGKGKITALFADAAKKRGETVIALALRGCTDESLASRVDRIEWFEWGQFHRAVLFGISQGLRKIVLLGKLEKEKFFDGSQAMDGEFKELVTRTRDRKDLSLLTNVADIIRKVGVEIAPCTDYLPELVPQAGVLTSRKPSKDELADIEYGKGLARELAGLEIGQTIAVKDKTVAGVEEQDAPRKFLEVGSPVWVEDKDAFLAIFPYDGFRISYTLSYNAPGVGSQYLDINIDEKSFEEMVAPARTFCLEIEAMELLKRGFGKGANYDNTVVLGKDGPIKTSLRFPDEPVRHKVLDLIGDLYLAGMPVKGHVVAIKSGHKLNMELVKRLKSRANI